MNDGGPKVVWLKVADDWNSIDFKLLKDKDIFSFDKKLIFTASCDAYVLDTALDRVCWSVLVVNKELEQLHLVAKIKKIERDKLLFG